MRTVAGTYGVVHRTLLEDHRRLVNMGLTGEVLRLNLHFDRVLPRCVYQPNTNTLAVCMPKLSELTDREVEAVVHDGMAMCGCHRSFKFDMRVWNASQNKARLPVPALAMHGEAKWRSIRSKLGEY